MFVIQRTRRVLNIRGAGPGAAQVEDSCHVLDVHQGCEFTLVMGLMSEEPLRR